MLFLLKTTSTFLLDQAEDHIQVDLIIYQQLIKKLIYLAYKIRPDITFVVGQVSRHNINP